MGKDYRLYRLTHKDKGVIGYKIVHLEQAGNSRADGKEPMYFI